ncbi:MAG: hypothetical protein IT371_00740 [Deltaproteobacteria bacterium]|nr:hypothetical protein [Deltaproteobacteria bacterium]
MRTVMLSVALATLLVGNLALARSRVRFNPAAAERIELQVKRGNRMTGFNVGATAGDRKLAKANAGQFTVATPKAISAAKKELRTLIAQGQEIHLEHFYRLFWTDNSFSRFVHSWVGGDVEVYRTIMGAQQKVQAPSANELNNAAALEGLFR